MDNSLPRTAAARVQIIHDRPPAWGWPVCEHPECEQRAHYHVDPSELGLRPSSAVQVCGRHLSTAVTVLIARGNDAAWRASR